MFSCLLYDSNELDWTIVLKINYFCNLKKKYYFNPKLSFWGESFLFFFLEVKSFLEARVHRGNSLRVWGKSFFWKNTLGGGPLFFGGATTVIWVWRGRAHLGTLVFLIDVCQ